MDPTSAEQVAKGIAAALNSAAGKELYRAFPHDTMAAAVANWFVHRLDGTPDPKADDSRADGGTFRTVAYGRIENLRPFVRVEPPKGKKPEARAYWLPMTVVHHARSNGDPIGVSKKGLVKSDLLHAKFEENIKAGAIAAVAHKEAAMGTAHWTAIRDSQLAAFNAQPEYHFGRGAENGFKLESGLKIGIITTQRGLLLGSIEFPRVSALDARQLFNALHALDEFLRATPELQAETK